MTINISQLPDLIMLWVKRIIGWLLVAFIALTVLKLFGFSVYSVQSMGWQEMGIFLAGTAYAIRNL